MIDWIEFRYEALRRAGAAHERLATIVAQYLSRGEIEEAEGAILEFLHVQPDHEPALLLLLSLLADTGRIGACEAVLSLARQASEGRGGRIPAGFYSDMHARFERWRGSASGLSREAYPSCEWVEGGLVFSKTAVSMCCILHHRDGGWFRLAGFESRPEVPVLRILHGRQRVRSANKRGGHPKCKGCSHLRPQRWDRRYFVTHVNLSHFHRCNLKCTYCYLEKPGLAPGTIGLKPRSPVPMLRSLLEGRDLLSRGASVFWGGGEPAILQEFEEIQTLLAEHGCRIGLNTNAVKYSDAVARSLGNSNTYLVCSLDAGTPATFELIKGAPVFEGVLMNLQRYRESAQRSDQVAVKYIFTKGNTYPAEVEAFVRAVEQHGLTHVVADLDQWLEELEPNLVACLSLLLARCHEVGVEATLGACGVDSIPELEVYRRVRAHLCTHHGLEADAQCRIAGRVD